jgi:hypothetical protein
VVHGRGAGVAPAPSNTIPMRRRLRGTVLLALALVLAPAVTGALSTQAAPKAGGPRLNHLQARGTHNSYHRDPGHEFGNQVGWDYSHQRLSRQLEEQGVRQVELDIHWNWARQEFEVYHAWFGDDRTTCQLLRDCLQEIRDWSDARPGHHPILILIEPKDGGPPRNTGLPEDGDPFTHPIGPAEYDQLDRVLLDAFDGPMSAGGRVITPDDVTVAPLTLRDSIRQHGWPLIDDVRQHVFYALDGDEHGQDYSQGWTTLSGRTLFVQAGADDPVAGFVRRSGSERPGSKYERMATVVAEGFMVRDLAGPSGFEAAKAAGAHFISSDEPDELHLSDHPKAPSRCNPVTAAPTCRDTEIERHTGPSPALPDEPDNSPETPAARLERLVGATAGSAQALVERSVP